MKGTAWTTLRQTRLLGVFKKDPKMQVSQEKFSLKELKHYFNKNYSVQSVVS